MMSVSSYVPRCRVCGKISRASPCNRCQLKLFNESEALKRNHFKEEIDLRNEENKVVKQIERDKRVKEQEEKRLQRIKDKEWTFSDNDIDNIAISMITYKYSLSTIARKLRANASIVYSLYDKISKSLEKRGYFI